MLIVAILHSPYDAQRLAVERMPTVVDSCHRRVMCIMFQDIVFQ